MKRTVKIAANKRVRRQGVEVNKLKGIKEWLQKRKNRFRRAAIAFIDYEYLFHSYRKFYRFKPYLKAIKAHMEESYQITELYVFGDFSRQELAGELPKLKEIESKIITTEQPNTYTKKSMTDFIMLDYLYRVTAANKKVKNCIILTDKEYFESALQHLRQSQKKRVILCKVQKSSCARLELNADEIIELPFSEEIKRGYYEMLVENLAYVVDTPNIIPTFMGVVNAVSRRNSVPIEEVKDALIEMLEKGWCSQRMKYIEFGRAARVVTANWEKLAEEGLWEFKKDKELSS